MAMASRAAKGGGLLKKAFGNALRRKSLPQAWRLFDEARQEIHQMRMSAWREALAAHEQEVSITRIFGH